MVGVVGRSCSCPASVSPMGSTRWFNKHILNLYGKLSLLAADDVKSTNMRETLILQFLSRHESEKV